MKRLIAISLAFVLCFAIAACGESESSESSGTTIYGSPEPMLSENCEMVTYSGTEVTASDTLEGESVGQIRYDISPDSSPVTVPGGGEVRYFKTEIINNDTKNAVDVSLSIGSLDACTLAVTYPANSVRTFSEAQTDLYIIRDVYVEKKDSDTGKLTVEWYVISGESDVTIDPGDLYLIYE